MRDVPLIEGRLLHSSLLSLFSLQLQAANAMSFQGTLKSLDTRVINQLMTKLNVEIRLLLAV